MSAPKFESPKGEIKAEAPKGKQQVVPSKRYEKGSSRKKDYTKVPQNSKFNANTWYEKYPELFEVASTLGFNHVQGKPYYNALAGYSARTNNVLDMKGLSFMRLKYITTPGLCDSSTSGFMMQMRKLYLAIRRKYRGLNTYEVGDLAVTIFCVLEFYRYVAKLERIYGVCKYFSTRNRVVPEQLKAMLGIEYSDIITHLADFRYGINALITRASSLCLPGSMDILNRWFLLESNIFKDSDNDRAAYYIFDDACLFHTYQSKLVNTGGTAALCYVNAAWNTADAGNYRELLASGSALLDQLLNDADVTLIMGDLVSFFSPEGQVNGLVRLEPLPEDYVVVPVHNEDVLHQINNATFTTQIMTPSNYTTVTEANFEDHGSMFTLYGGVDKRVLVRQDIYGAVEYTPYISDSAAGQATPNLPVYFDLSNGNLRNHVSSIKAGNLLLNTWDDAPKASEIMEMSRLTTFVGSKSMQVGTAWVHQLPLMAFGTEILVDAEIGDTDVGEIGDGINLYSCTSSGDFDYLLASELSQFDWHPRLYLIQSISTASTAGNGWTYEPVVLGDLDNARVITNDVLLKIHDAAVMSLFDISEIK